MLCAVILLTSACQSQAQDASSSVVPDSLRNRYVIGTPQGDIVIRLYDETPGHRDNFAKLVDEEFFDGTLFHRVIANFMLQGGDPNSLDDNPYDDGQGGPGYMIDAEFKPQFIHKRGAIAAARTGDQGNPDRKSSGSQFYIVHGGRPFTDAMLDDIEGNLRRQIPDSTFAFSPEAREFYRTVGGAPHLDGMYTVFGEVISGMDVVDRIAAIPTARSQRQRVPPQVIDKPFEDVPMTVRRYTP